ncbi:MAG TPA: Ig-like domain-containing protein [Syntrophomonadaceae bacterium]|nr:Ig-like domain-containing protein [Syntrophomonadaceae bacterium]
MFKWKKFINILLVVMLLFILSGCGSPDTEANISLYPGYMELAKGSKVKLAVKVVPAGLNKELQWVSGSPEVASVSTDGTVTAKQEGDTLIDVVLKGSAMKKASCAVHVKREGAIYVYLNVPQKPSDTTKPSDEKNDGDKPKEEQKQDGDENIPTEYDQSQDIPVEVIPSLDEFVWTISIDDTCEKSLNTELGDIKASYHFKLLAVKSGDKIPDGQYKCSATQEVKVDSSDMDESIESEIGGTVKSDNSIKTEVKDCTFNIVPYDSNTYNFYGMNKGEVPPLPPLGLTISKMATGTMAFSTNAAFSKSVHTEEGSGTGKGAVNKANVAIPFKIYITRDGEVNLTIIGKGSLGPLEFRGRLSKRPIRPK